MLVRELLQAVSRYPIPLAKLNAVACRRGLILDKETDILTVTSSSYELATADLLVWLSTAPNISQGGQSYSFNSDERKELKARAIAIYKKHNEEESITEYQYGYKGQYL